MNQEEKRQNLSLSTGEKETWHDGTGASVTSRKSRTAEGGSRWRIRVMVQEDCLHVYRLLKACFRDPWSLESLEGMFRVPGYLCLVAEKEGKIHGFAGMKRVMDEADITDVAVLEEDRGLGLATDLLTRLLTMAAARGTGLVFLEVRASNAAALALYRKTGFASAGLRKNYYRDPVEDGLLMQWSPDRLRQQKDGLCRE